MKFKSELKISIKHLELNSNSKKDSKIYKNEEKVTKRFHSNKIKTKQINLIYINLYPFNFILLGIFLLILPKKILLAEHFIILKVGKIGYQQILSDEYYGENPSVIYINNEVQVLRGKKVYIDNINNEIKLEWNNVMSNFTYMFYNLTSITSVNMHYIFGNNCNLTYMFYNCKILESFTYSIYNNNSYLIKDTIGMFYNCITLKNFSFYNFYMDYYSCCYKYYNRNMSYMFFNCQKLESIDEPRNTIRYISDMRGMFYNCTNLIAINLEKFQTSQNFHVNASYMFYNCISLESFSFSSKTDIYFFTNDMNNMFFNCILIDNINLNQISTNDAINISRFFYNCTNLVNLQGDFKNIFLFDVRELFYNCTNLKKNDYLTIYINNNNRNYNVNMSKMFYNCISLKEVRIYGKYGSSNYIFPSDLHSMFYNCLSLTSVLFEYIYLDYIKDMSYMFFNCKDLQKFDRNYFKVYNSIKETKRSMKGMFQNCRSLESLALNNAFNSKNVENMWDMFKGCKNLLVLNLEDPNYFDTSKVTDMESMFEECTSLITLNLNKFNTANVQYMNKMFYNCENLKSLYFSSINSNSLGTMHQMFYNCKNLEYLNLFSLTEKDQSISEMFKGASTSFKFCVNDSDKIPNIFAEIFNMSSSERDCEESCYGIKRIEIKEKKLCCPKFEYNGYCFDKCPSKTRDMENNKICQNFSCPYGNKNNEFKYYDYDQNDCIDSVPEGYFCNDSIFNTIDKCHDKCRTCNESATDSNHTNCDSCKKGYIFLGNCYDNCSRGFYQTDVCKCFDERCLLCSENNIRRGLCDICEENYYPIEDNQNAPFNCYQNLTKYYLSGKFYHRCHSSCQTCEKAGTEDIHNCLTCDSNNSFPLRKNGYYNCYPNCTYYFYFNEKNKYTCTVDNNCPDNYELIVPDINQCVVSCIKTDDYQYRFQNKCYHECPTDSIILDPEEKTCKLSCPFERPFMMKSLGICVSNCTINERQIKECVTNYFGNRSNAEIQDIILNDLETHLTSSKYNFSIIKEGSIIIEEEKTNYELTTTQNEDDNSITSTLDLSLCESALRDFYSIDKQEALYILKYDIYVEGKEGPTVRYRVYYPIENSNILEPLDLTICENLPIIISLPANITGDPSLYDKNSAYYNDLCVHYSFNDGVDMTLEDRQRQYIENNKSLCEEDCNFAGYDKQTGKVDCSCEVKFTLPLVSEIKVDKDKLYKFMDIKKIANFNVLKCYKLITSKVGLITNVGFYLYIPTLITFFLAIIIFYAKDYKFLKNQINDIVYAKKFMKYLPKKRPKPPNKPEKKVIKPPSKFVDPIFLQVMEKKQDFEENYKNPDQKIKSVKTSIVAKIMQNVGLSNIINNNIIKEDNLDNLIEKNNINNENVAKKDENDKNNINNDLISEKNEIPKDNKKKINAPPIKDKIPNTFNVKKISPNTETNIDKNFFPSSKNNLDFKKRGIQITNYNVENNSKESGILSKEEEEKIRTIMKKNDSELNVLDYKEAVKYDNRNYFQYYFSLLRTKHMIVKVISNNDYNSRMIKIYLIAFNFSLCYAVNALFFNDDTMHKILEDGGDFNIVYQLPQIIYSAIISFIFENILNFLALSEENVLSVKHEKITRNVKRKAEEVLRTLQMKFLSFFILGFCFLLAFWYYVTCFCAVYTNTQYHLMKDTLISFGTSQITPFGLNLIPGLFRIPAIKSRKEFLYLISKILQLF